MSNKCRNCGLPDFGGGVPGCDPSHLLYSSDDLCVVVYDSNEAFLEARGA